MRHSDPALAKPSRSWWLPSRCRTILTMVGDGNRLASTARCAAYNGRPGGYPRLAGEASSRMWSSLGIRIGTSASFHPRGLRPADESRPYAMNAGVAGSY